MVGTGEARSTSMEPTSLNSVGSIESPRANEDGVEMITFISLRYIGDEARGVIVWVLNDEERGKTRSIDGKEGMIDNGGGTERRVGDEDGVEDGGGKEGRVGDEGKEIGFDEDVGNGEDVDMGSFGVEDAPDFLARQRACLSRAFRLVSSMRAASCASLKT